MTSELSRHGAFLGRRSPCNITLEKWRKTEKEKNLKKQTKSVYSSKWCHLSIPNKHFDVNFNDLYNYTCKT